ncbi:flavin reductase family protein [Streptomyces tendae]|uniref:flavin reductase family protein n=1 Tax=Streptomyces tendae TaxID=1932 RepID=UPI003F4CF7F4
MSPPSASAAPTRTSSSNRHRPAATVGRSEMHHPPTAVVPTDTGQFRAVLGHFGSGVTVISAVDAATGRPVGFTCQSFTSLSLDPPLVAFTVARTSVTWPRIRSAGAFCVNVLAAGQESLCRSFARSGTDKFAGVDWRPAAGTGSPLLAGVLAWIDCRIEAVHPGGDHSIVIGRVQALAGPAGDTREPLLYYGSEFRRLAATAPAP